MAIYDDRYDSHCSPRVSRDSLWQNTGTIKSVFDMAGPCPSALLRTKLAGSRRVEAAQIGFPTDKITHTYMNAFIKGTYLV